MKAVTVTDRSYARELLPDNSKEDILVLRNGRAVAVVMPFDDDDKDWYARERDPEFVESVRRAREQVKRGETISERELDAVLAESTDGIDLTDFSPPVSVETLRRTKCSRVPIASGIYLVLRPSKRTPLFLKKSVGGWFKEKDPSDPLSFVKGNWVDDATILYIGKGDGKKGLRQRLGEFIQFGMGKRIGHRGGRLIWHLQNHQQLLIRWRLTPSEDPHEVETRLIERFRSVHGARPFANLNK